MRSESDQSNKEHVAGGRAVKRKASRSSDLTRAALIDAATSVFADVGYEAGAVRAITRIARANQAAITYHFGGKDGLYRAVLRAAVAAFEEQSLVDEHVVRDAEKVEAVRVVMRQFLLPLSQSGRLGRYIRIFGREGIEPSAVYLAFFAEEPPRLFGLVETLVRRFLPENAEAKRVALTTFWLLQQPVTLVRDAERLRGAPYGLTFSPDEIDDLVTFLTELSLGGLSGQTLR